MSNTDDVKGRAKEAVGAVTGDDDLKHDGQTDQAAGKVKGALDNVKDKAEHAVDSIKDKLHKD